MSIFSDHECGALSDFEYDQECRRMNRQDRYEREHLYDDPDYPNPESDEWCEAHCPKCVHYSEKETNGQIWAECDDVWCEYEERETEQDQAYTDKGITLIEVIISFFIIGIVGITLYGLIAYGNKPVSEMPIWLYWLLKD